MTPFIDCSIAIKNLIFVWSTLLVLLSFFNLGRIILNKRSRSLLSVSIPALICYYALTQLSLEVLKSQNIKGTLKLAGQTPIYALIVFAVILTISGLVLTFYISKQNLSTVTPYSIKASIDTLPEGLCCYLDSGLVKLKNSAMDRICREISGKALLNGRAFWTALTEGKFAYNAAYIKCGENPIVRIRDGSVFSFTRNELNIENHILYEITASDITEEYRVNNALKEKQEKADETNQRLKNLNSTITDLTIEKETLEAKIQIHDNLGNALLSAKKYLLNETETKKDEMLRFWRLNIMLLKNEPTENWQDKYADCLRSAALVGVEIKISGKLPEDIEAYAVVEKAISACAANTVRHAKGNELMISCLETDTQTVISFRNNGILPTEDIKETGGLKNLRRVVEYFGGTMKINIKPEFVLTIVLKKKVSK